MVSWTMNQLKGKTAIVTGSSSGIGFEAAKALARNGARVIIASRDENKLRRAKQEITTETGNDNVDYRMFDAGSLKSVRNFAHETIANEDRLDILVNSIGSLGLPDQLTEDGLHTMMQVNYFGTFLLTFLLLPLLKSSAPSRIINVTGGAMYIGRIDFEHLNDVEYWSSIKLLANSKLAESLFTVELADRLKGSGVTSNSFDPFVVSDTDILKNLPSGIKEVGNFFIRFIGRDKGVVGEEIMYIASDPTLDGITGKNFKFGRVFPNTWLANDLELRKKLWDRSKELVGISDTEDLF